MMPCAEETDRQRARLAIDAIGRLPDNWNQNGAAAFSSELLARAREAVALLPRVPVVVPTARQGIWFEYHDRERGRLVFELFEDGSITQYYRNAAGETITRPIQLDEMPQSVRHFYA